MKFSAPHSPPNRTFILRLTSGLLATLLCASGLTQAAASPIASNNQPPDFTILTPDFGSYQTGQVDVKLQYVTENEDPKVRVRLNGRAINDGRFTKSCRGAICSVTGQLTLWDGLRTGENQITATLAGRLHHLASPTKSTPVLLARTRFDYRDSQGLQGGQYNSVYFSTPVSLGLSTIPTGGGSAGTPWLQLTTGYPADWNAVADAYAFPALPDANNAVTIPYPDVSEGFTCTGGTFQAYVLGRQNPYQGGPSDQNVETGACFNTIQDLQSLFLNKMGRSLGSQDLVILGTAPGQTVPAGFDASALGGTNYSQTPASEYPQAYIMIGVPGASPASAYESFSIPPASNRPNTAYQPALNGTLMVDQNGNYNFISSGDAAFQVHSDASAGSSYIQVGNNTYTPPPSSGNNFWLLVLDQETLRPVNYYLSPYTAESCDTTSTTQSCGAIYTVAADGGNALANELNNLSNAHDLIFLVSEGCPVGNPNQIQSSLANVLHSIGGAPYSLEYQGVTTHPQNYCNYSLVTVNDGNHWHPLNDPTALSVGGAFFSNNQYGSLQGFLARNQQGLYDVAGKAQMIPNNDGPTLTSPIDYTFEFAASSQRQDWPLVDTAWPIEAYADLSYQILSGLGKTGSRLYDVRYFYTDSGTLTNGQLSTILQNNLIGTPTQPAAHPFTAQLWDNATPEQFAAARQQIGGELQQALSAYGYLGPTGVSGQLSSSTSTIYADMIGVAQTISTDYSNTSSANADVRLSKVLNLTGSVVGLGSIVPGIGPIFGVVGGALRVGSGALALANSNTPPSPSSVFDTTLSSLTNDAISTYAGNLITGFDGAVDNILSDSGKLASIAALTSNTDSGWNFPSQISADQLHDPLVNGAARSMWLDILPQLYGIRQFFGGPSSNPGDYGQLVSDITGNKCDSLYSNADPAAYGAYTTVGNTKQYDLYVLAESPKASSNDTVVSKALADLLTTNTGTSNESGLNLPSMLLYAYSNMTYSPFQAPASEFEVTYCSSK